MPPKRKRSSTATNPSTELPPSLHSTPILPPARATSIKPPLPKRLSSRRNEIDTNPDRNTDIIDGKAALRASPDADEVGESVAIDKISQGPVTTSKADGIELLTQQEDSDSPLSELDSQSAVATPVKKKRKTPTKSSIAAKKGSDEIKAFRAEQAAKKAAEQKKIKKEDDGDEWENRQDPDGDDVGPVEDVDIMKKEAGRPPPVHSDYLPLPWKGRLGYACLNTYLRFSNPPVFTSRTCRIASILEHRHPLKDPTQPEHATKNRPDKTKPPSIERGQRYVEDIGLANARDLPKMLRWNDKYGIKFMRLSSEMFPFASHAEYGYKLAPFASEALEEVGKVAAQLGHRLSTHPGQFTQLGSPRAEVINNAIRDLEYHDELLTLLKLPPQSDRDAVLILHLGGTFGDKSATLDRFRENYKNLSPSIKRRIVLENDDVSWSVHDLLPLCEELNIPLCLDFHHHNIIFDSTQVREGTKDIIPIFPRIKATWDRKQIKQKMHYSEPTPEAVTGRQRRKHNPRKSTLPPCPNDMDLMIEAKDKEQAVFELMRTFKLPGFERINDIIPYERSDDNKPVPKKPKKKKTKKQIANEIEEFGKELSEEEEAIKDVIPEKEVGMGGKENRVYWPVGMEEWLRPKKREIKKKGPDDEEDMFKNPTPANFAARKAISARNKEPLGDEIKERLLEASNVSDIQRILEDIKSARATATAGEAAEDENEKPSSITKSIATAKRVAPRKQSAKVVPTPSISNLEDEEDDDFSMPDLSASDEDPVGRAIKAAEISSVPARQSMRVKRTKSYVEPEPDANER